MILPEASDTKIQIDHGEALAVSSPHSPVDNLLVDVRNTPQNANAVAFNGLGSPPEFTQYEAEHFEVGYSDVVSHDPHLNSDGFFSFQ